MTNKEAVLKLDLSAFREVDETDYARYDLGDTLTIRLGSYNPRFFVIIGSKGTKEKQREIVERIFGALSKATLSIVEENNKEKMYRHFLKFIKLQEEFPKVCLVELDVFVEGTKEILNILGGKDGTQN